MAEEIKNNQLENNENKPTVDELMERISQLTEERNNAFTERDNAFAERDKHKSANNKLSKENAEYKRVQREGLDERERRIAELEEQLMDATTRAEESEKSNNYMKAVNAYKGIDDEKVVEELIDAVSNAKHSVIAENFAKAYNKGFSDGQQKYLDGRPEVNYGGSETPKTKEEIKKVKDATERQRLIAENIDLF